MSRQTFQMHSNMSCCLLPSCFYMGVWRHGQGGTSVPWKCCKVFFCAANIAWSLVDEVFMHYFEKMSSILCASPRPRALPLDPVGWLPSIRPPAGTHVFLYILKWTKVVEYGLIHGEVVTATGCCKCRCVGCENKAVKLGNETSTLTQPESTLQFH